MNINIPGSFITYDRSFSSKDKSEALLLISVLKIMSSSFNPVNTATCETNVALINAQ